MYYNNIIYYNILQIKCKTSHQLKIMLHIKYKLIRKLTFFLQFIIQFLRFLVHSYYKTLLMVIYSKIHNFDSSNVL